MWIKGQVGASITLHNVAARSRLYTALKCSGRASANPVSRPRRHLSDVLAMHTVNVDSLCNNCGERDGSDAMINGDEAVLCFRLFVGGLEVHGLVRVARVESGFSSGETAQSLNPTEYNAAIHVQRSETADRRKRAKLQQICA